MKHVGERFEGVEKLRESPRLKNVSQRQLSVGAHAVQLRVPSHSPLAYRLEYFDPVSLLVRISSLDPVFVLKWSTKFNCWEHSPKLR